VTTDSPVYDALVIGGGFYGCEIALFLRRHGFGRVRLVEREPALLTRASYANQARVHNGYHYPRSFVTAWRSHQSFARFVADYHFAIRSDFVQLYAVARHRSKVTPTQYQHFMRDIGAPFAPARPEYRALFDPRTVAAIYETEECAFDAAHLRTHFSRALPTAGIQTSLGTELVRVLPDGGKVIAELRSPTGTERVAACWLLNCTYARANFTVGQPGQLQTPLKHEVAEIALITAPDELTDLGVTLMDGPFFSCMPFPAGNCHSLSHMRYTPHGAQGDNTGAKDPLRALEDGPPVSRAHLMVADAARYLPCLRGGRYQRSLFEIKTVLARQEVSDGRPVLVRQEFASPGMITVLGGKLDNIYDVCAKLTSVLNIGAARGCTTA
jgi:glycine/D-amino acid oxidase-like deaminating enzyme